MEYFRVFILICISFISVSWSVWRKFNTRPRRCTFRRSGASPLGMFWSPRAFQNRRHRLFVKDGTLLRENEIFFDLVASFIDIKEIAVSVESRSKDGLIDVGVDFFKSISFTGLEYTKTKRKNNALTFGVSDPKGVPQMIVTFATATLHPKLSQHEHTFLIDFERKTEWKFRHLFKVYDTAVNA